MHINVSAGKLNWTQRNNIRDPYNTCNVTSMIMALDYLGYEFPDGKYERPTDNLHCFMEEKELRPTWHEELSLATNLWMGQFITEFSTERPIPEILNELKGGRPVVLSGDFPGYPIKRPQGPLGHIVVLVGADWDGPDTGLPSSIIIDDPYGNTLNNWQGSGNDIVLPWNLFIEWFKYCGSPHTKWAHYFKEL